jgi:mannosyltransferase OCH1-like enzyme
MRLFQYWDTGAPPDDVAACVESFHALNPDMRPRLFDRDDAAWFIGKYLGDRELRAFEACAVPAMQADYFRLAALVARGGVWADTDWLCVAPLVGLLEQVPHSLLLVLENRLVTELMVARHPDDRFFRACLELATRNIEDRLDFGVLGVTGAGVPNAVWAACGAPAEDADRHLSVDWRHEPLVDRALAIAGEGVLEAAQAMTRRHVLWPGQWLRGVDLAYKQTDRHWFRWPGPVYNAPAPAAAAP